jgi:uncharacterized protein (TIGR03437 family)
VINFVRKAAPFISTSAANYKNAQAPGSIATAFAAAGSTVATGTEIANIPLPTMLAGSTVTINSFAGFTLTNETRKAALYYASPNQINYYLPSDVSQGPAEIQIEPSSGLILRSSALITNIAPALFSVNWNGQGLAAAVVQRIKADDSISYEPVAMFNTVQGSFEAVPIDFGPDTDRVFLDLFGTGIRNRSSLSNVLGKVGGVDSQVFYAGPQNEFEGLDQVNILLPRSLAGRGAVDVVLTIDGQTTNPVTIKAR